MKKIFAILMTVAMLLAMGTVLASAELPDDVSWTAGGYSTDAADFTPAGDFAITWDPDASTKLDLTDGDMADWAAAEYNMVTLDASNMVYWVNDTTNGTGVPEGWQISTYFVADSDWFYIGFFVTDPNHAVGSAGNYQSGDAFQVCIDFGGRLGDMLETDPDNLPNKKNIFYSFCNIGGEGAPIEIMRQESDQDGWLSEANGDGVKGATKTTETGWSAEFAFSWDQLYGDYTYKAWEDPTIYVGGDQNLPLKIGCCLYYLDRSAGSDVLNWAAGSTNGVADDNGTPHVSWTAYDNGINLALTYAEGMVINCEGIQALELTETIPEETEAPETEAPETEAKTQAPETEAKTEAPGTEAATVAGTEATTDTPAEGCSSAVAFGAVAVLAAAAAAVVLKKKD